MRIEPRDIGLAPLTLESLRGGEPEVNAARMKTLFEGEQGPFRDAVVLNAAAAIWVAGLAKTLQEGAELARSALDGGHARRKLEQLAAMTSATSEARAG